LTERHAFELSAALAQRCLLEALIETRLPRTSIAEEELASATGQTSILFQIGEAAVRICVERSVQLLE
jgi:hypothetical protein